MVPQEGQIILGLYKIQGQPGLHERLAPAPENSVTDPWNGIQMDLS